MVQMVSFLYYRSMERWKDVPGFEGKYQISIDTKEGRCRSLSYNKTGNVRILSNKVAKNGRIFWNLWKNNICTHYQAARWIALTYPELIQNKYFEGAEIDHINTDRLDNRPENLRWVDKKENLNNPLTITHLSSINKGKHMSEQQKAKISRARMNHPASSKPVIQYDLEWHFIKQYPSASQAERETGALMENIRACCKGKQKTAKGFKWKYA